MPGELPPGTSYCAIGLAFTISEPACMKEGCLSLETHKTRLCADGPTEHSGTRGLKEPSPACLLAAVVGLVFANAAFVATLQIRTTRNEKGL